MGERIGLIVSNNLKAKNTAASLLQLYSATNVSVRFCANMPVWEDIKKFQDISRFVAVGGDGTCLRALRIAYEIAHMKQSEKTPRVFGLNCGHIGALSNPVGNIYELPKRFEEAAYHLAKPLSVKTTFRNKIIYHTFFNEVILRPYANITHLDISWKEEDRYRKKIRGGLMVATKIGENAMNACNYTGPEEIATIPNDNYWRISTLNAMPNDAKYDKPFQRIVPASTTVLVNVINPYDDRNAQIMGDSYYNEGEEPLLDSQGDRIGTKVKMLFVDKIRITTAKYGVLLAREKSRERE